MSLSQFYQNILSNEEITLDDMYKTPDDMSQMTESIARVSINDDVISPLDTGGENNTHIVAQLKRDFKSHILRFEELQDKLSKVTSANNTAARLRANITNDMKSLHHCFQHSIKDHELLDELHEQLNDVMNRIQIYTCTGTSEIEKEMDAVSNELRQAKGDVKCGIDIFKCTSACSKMPVCPICMNAGVEVFCNPCGHTYCSACIQSDKCYLCRMKIIKIQRLFFV